MIVLVTDEKRVVTSTFDVTVVGAITGASKVVKEVMVDIFAEWLR